MAAVELTPLQQFQQVVHKIQALNAFQNAGNFLAIGVHVDFNEHPEESEALHTAAFKGDTGKIKSLVADGTPVDAKDAKIGRTPLHWAAVRGQLGALEVLKNLGADMHAPDHTRFTPLMLAALHDECKFVEKILDAGATIDNIDREGFTALHWAASQGHLGAIELLCERKANKEARDNQGRTPLTIAAGTGKVKLVRLLIKLGADVDSVDDKGHSAFHWATGNNHVGVIEELLKAGGDVNKQNHQGASALHFAAYEGLTACVFALAVQGKADARLVNHEDCTALHWAAARGRARCMEMLIKSGSDINHKDEDGHTPLQRAALSEHYGCVKACLEHKCDINSKDNDGRTVIHYASASGDIRILDMMEGHSADLDSQDEGGGTPLHCAAFAGQSDAMNVLHDRGADINKRDFGDRTPMHWAANGGHAECVKLLVEKGASVNIQDEDRQTPFDYADMGEHGEAKKELKKNGGLTGFKIDYNAATKIQSVYRGFDTRQKLSQQLRQTIVVQSVARRFLAKKRAREMAAKRNANIEAMEKAKRVAEEKRLADEAAAAELERIQAMQAPDAVASRFEEAVSGAEDATRGNDMDVIAQSSSTYEEALRALKHIPPPGTAMFNVNTAADTVEAAQEGLVRADKSERAKAKAALVRANAEAARAGRERVLAGRVFKRMKEAKERAARRDDALATTANLSSDVFAVTSASTTLGEEATVLSDVLGTLGDAAKATGDVDRQMTIDAQKTALDRAAKVLSEASATLAKDPENRALRNKVATAGQLLGDELAAATATISAEETRRKLERSLDTIAAELRRVDDAMEGDGDARAATLNASAAMAELEAELNILRESALSPAEKAAMSAAGQRLGVAANVLKEAGAMFATSPTNAAAIEQLHGARVEAESATIAVVVAASATKDTLARVSDDLTEGRAKVARALASVDGSAPDRVPLQDVDALITELDRLNQHTAVLAAAADADVASFLSKRQDAVRLARKELVEAVARLKSASKKDAPVEHAEVLAASARLAAASDKAFDAALAESYTQRIAQAEASASSGMADADAGGRTGVQGVTQAHRAVVSLSATLAGLARVRGRDNGVELEHVAGAAVAAVTVAGVAAVVCSRSSASSQDVASANMEKKKASEAMMHACAVGKGSARVSNEQAILDAMAQVRKNTMVSLGKMADAPSGEAAAAHVSGLERNALLPVNEAAKALSLGASAAAKERLTKQRGEVDKARAAINSAREGPQTSMHSRVKLTSGAAGVAVLDLAGTVEDEAAARCLGALHAAALAQSGPLTAPEGKATSTVLRAGATMSGRSHEVHNILDRLSSVAGSDRRAKRIGAAQKALAKATAVLDDEMTKKSPGAAKVAAAGREVLDAMHVAVDAGSTQRSSEGGLLEALRRAAEEAGPAFGVLKSERLQAAEAPPPHDVVQENCTVAVRALVALGDRDPDVAASAKRVDVDMKKALARLDKEISAYSAAPQDTPHRAAVNSAAANAQDVFDRAIAAAELEARRQFVTFATKEAIALLQPIDGALEKGDTGRVARHSDDFQECAAEMAEALRGLALSQSGPRAAAMQRSAQAIEDAASELTAAAAAFKDNPSAEAAGRVALARAAAEAAVSESVDAANAKKSPEEEMIERIADTRQQAGGALADLKESSDPVVVDQGRVALGKDCDTILSVLADLGKTADTSQTKQHLGATASALEAAKDAADTAAMAFVKRPQDAAAAARLRATAVVLERALDTAVAVARGELDARRLARAVKAMEEAERNVDDAIAKGSSSDAKRAAGSYARAGGDAMAALQSMAAHEQRTDRVRLELNTAANDVGEASERQRQMAGTYSDEDPTSVCNLEDALANAKEATQSALKLGMARARYTRDEDLGNALVASKERMDEHLKVSSETHVAVAALASEGLHLEDTLGEVANTAQDAAGIRKASQDMKLEFGKMSGSLSDNADWRRQPQAQKVAHAAVCAGVAETSKRRVLSTAGAATASLASIEEARERNDGGEAHSIRRGALEFSASGNDMADALEQKAGVLSPQHQEHPAQAAAQVRSAAQELSKASEALFKAPEDATRAKAVDAAVAVAVAAVALAVASAEMKPPGHSASEQAQAGRQAVAEAVAHLRGDSGEPTPASVAGAQNAARHEAAQLTAALDVLLESCTDPAESRRLQAAKGRIADALKELEDAVAAFLATPDDPLAKARLRAAADNFGNAMEAGASTCTEEMRRREVADTSAAAEASLAELTRAIQAGDGTGAVMAAATFSSHSNALQKALRELAGCVEADDPLRAKALTGAANVLGAQSKQLSLSAAHFKQDPKNAEVKFALEMARDSAHTALQHATEVGSELPPAAISVFKATAYARSVEPASVAALSSGKASASAGGAATLHVCTTAMVGVAGTLPQSGGPVSALEVADADVQAAVAGGSTDAGTLAGSLMAGEVYDGTLAGAMTALEAESAEALLAQGEEEFFRAIAAYDKAARADRGEDERARFERKMASIAASRAMGRVARTAQLLGTSAMSAPRAEALARQANQLVENMAALEAAEGSGTAGASAAAVESMRTGLALCRDAPSKNALAALELVKSLARAETALVALEADGRGQRMAPGGVRYDEQAVQAEAFIVKRVLADLTADATRTEDAGRTAILNVKKEAVARAVGSLSVAVSKLEGGADPAGARAAIAEAAQATRHALRGAVAEGQAEVAGHLVRDIALANGQVQQADSGEAQAPAAADEVKGATVLQSILLSMASAASCAPIRGRELENLASKLDSKKTVLSSSARANSSSSLPSREVAATGDIVEAVARAGAEAALTPTREEDALIDTVVTAKRRIDAACKTLASGGSKAELEMARDTLETEGSSLEGALRATGKLKGGSPLQHKLQADAAALKSTQADLLVAVDASQGPNPSSQVVGACTRFVSLGADATQECVGDLTRRCLEEGEEEVLAAVSALSRSTAEGTSRLELLNAASTASAKASRIANVLENLAGAGTLNPTATKGVVRAGDAVRHAAVEVENTVAAHVGSGGTDESTQELNEAVDALQNAIHFAVETGKKSTAGQPLDNLISETRKNLRNACGKLALAGTLTKKEEKGATEGAATAARTIVGILARREVASNHQALVDNLAEAVNGANAGLDISLRENAEGQHSKVHDAASSLQDAGLAALEGAETLLLANAMDGFEARTNERLEDVDASARKGDNVGVRDASKRAANMMNNLASTLKQAAASAIVDPTRRRELRDTGARVQKAADELGLAVDEYTADPSAEQGQQRLAQARANASSVVAYACGVGRARKSRLAALEEELDAAERACLLALDKSSSSDLQLGAAQLAAVLATMRKEARGADLDANTGASTELDIAVNAYGRGGQGSRDDAARAVGVAVAAGRNDLVHRAALSHREDINQALAGLVRAAKRADVRGTSKHSADALGASQRLSDALDAYASRVEDQSGGDDDDENIVAREARAASEALQRTGQQLSREMSAQAQDPGNPVATGRGNAAIDDVLCAAERACEAIGALEPTEARALARLEEIKKVLPAALAVLLSEQHDAVALESALSTVGEEVEQLEFILGDLASVAEASGDMRQAKRLEAPLSSFVSRAFSAVAAESDAGTEENMAARRAVARKLRSSIEFAVYEATLYAASRRARAAADAVSTIAEEASEGARQQDFGEVRRAGSRAPALASTLQNAVASPAADYLPRRRIDQVTVAGEALSDSAARLRDAANHFGGGGQGADDAWAVETASGQLQDDSEYAVALSCHHLTRDQQLLAQMSAARDRLHPHLGAITASSAGAAQEAQIEAAIISAIGADMKEKTTDEVVRAKLQRQSTAVDAATNRMKKEPGEEAAKHLGAAVKALCETLEGDLSRRCIDSSERTATELLRGLEVSGHDTALDPAAVEDSTTKLASEAATLEICLLQLADSGSPERESRMVAAADDLQHAALDVSAAADVFVRVNGNAHARAGLASARDAMERAIKNAARIGRTRKSPEQLFLEKISENQEKRDAAFKVLTGSNQDASKVPGAERTMQREVAFLASGLEELERGVALGQEAYAETQEKMKGHAKLVNDTAAKYIQAQSTDTSEELREAAQDTQDDISTAIDLARAEILKRRVDAGERRALMALADVDQAVESAEGKLAVRAADRTVAAVSSVCETVHDALPGMSEEQGRELRGMVAALTEDSNALVDAALAYKVNPRNVKARQALAKCREKTTREVSEVCRLAGGRKKRAPLEASPPRNYGTDYKSPYSQPSPPADRRSGPRRRFQTRTSQPSPPTGTSPAIRYGRRRASQPYNGLEQPSMNFSGNPLSSGYTQDDYDWYKEGITDREAWEELKRERRRKIQGDRKVKGERLQAWKTSKQEGFHAEREGRRARRAELQRRREEELALKRALVQQRRMAAKAPQRPGYSSNSRFVSPKRRARVRGLAPIGEGNSGSLTSREQRRPEEPMISARGRIESATYEAAE